MSWRVRRAGRRDVRRPTQGTGPARRATAHRSMSGRSSRSATSCTTGRGSPNETPPSGSSSMRIPPRSMPCHATSSPGGGDSARATSSGPSTAAVSWRSERRRRGSTSMRSSCRRCRPSRRWPPSRPTRSASTPGSACSRRSSTCSTSAPSRSPAASWSAGGAGRVERARVEREGFPSASPWWRRRAPTGSCSTWPIAINGWSTVRSVPRVPGSDRPRSR